MNLFSSFPITIEQYLSIDFVKYRQPTQKRPPLLFFLAYAGMNTILTRALQPLRPLFAASVSRPRVSDVNGLLHGVGGAGARVRPVLGGSRITSGILPAVSPSPPSSFLFFSSSPAARANAATGVKAPEVDWYSDKWREAPLPRDLRRKRERLEKKGGLKEEACDYLEAC